MTHFYRRGKHHAKKDSLTVDDVLCEIQPSGHFNAKKTHICFHDMNIHIPDWSPENIAIWEVHPR